MMNGVLAVSCRLFDRLQVGWESPLQRRLTGNLLVTGFLGAMLAIELNRQDLLPRALAQLIPHNHFYAVELAFMLLLLIEVISLVFSLAHSVANSVGKQFEVFSLILLRHTFEEFTAFPEPVQWTHVHESVVHMASNAVGALLVFVALGVFYRLQRHRPITHDSEERQSFIATKKLLSLVLLAIFLLIGLHDAVHAMTDGESYPFFESFYTVLIFVDILLVLISLRYSSTYLVVFRNSGFAAATVFVRLALTAPPIYNAVLGLVAILFACGLTLAYNAFASSMEALEAVREEG